MEVETMWRNFTSDVFDDMWGNLRSMQRELDNLFRRIPAESRAEHQLTSGEETTENLPFWSGYPLVDAWTDEDKLNVRAELPGMKPEDISVSVHENQLLISGKRSFERKAEGRHYILREVGAGRFERRFHLPDRVDPERIEASYSDGVLSLRMPLIEAAKPKRIPVSISSEKEPVHAS
jgi:HSP20 family protein